MAGYVKVDIVLPSVIYGLATGELLEQGIQNPHTLMIRFAQIALDRGRSGIVGAGLNIWPNVDIQEGKSPTISLIFRANIVVQSRWSLRRPLRLDYLRSSYSTCREGIYFGEKHELSVSNALVSFLTNIGCLQNQMNEGSEDICAICTTLKWKGTYLFVRGSQRDLGINLMTTIGTLGVQEVSNIVLKTQ